MGSVTQFNRQQPDPNLDRLLAQKIPYPFAKRHGVIAAHQLQNAIELWALESARPEVLSEISRYLGQPYVLQLLNSDEFENALNVAYERDLGQAMDLSAELAYR